MTDGTCTLCGYALDERARLYSEGLFCEDVAGCRRRALKRFEEQMKDTLELANVIRELEHRLSHYERVDEPVDDPDSPASREP